MSAERIDPRQARDDMGSGAILVCAYDDDAKFAQNHLEGAMSLAEFRSREAALPRGREVIFYCA